MKSLFLTIAVILCFGCSPKKKPKTKLVVLISIDQMRGDYLDLFESQIDNGFKVLTSKGAVFKNANHNHFNTTTAAGHATIATGCFPSKNGITDNTIYDRQLKRNRYSIDDSTVTFIGVDTCDLEKVSANRLLKPSFGDYVKSLDSASKYYSVALKDRSAVLMGGHNANRAFWFNAATTSMVSTDYYKESFPDWVKTYKANEVLIDNLNEGWILENNFKRVSSTSVDSIVQEKDCFYPTFPHTIKSIDSNEINSNLDGAYFWNTPFGDKYVLEFSKQLIDNEHLGEDDIVDILTIGLSAADIIGHHFGPNSYEVLDYYNKLDLYLAEFIEYLNQKVGRDNYLLVLTSDHGVAPFPELAKPELDAQRITQLQFDSDIDAIDKRLKEVYHLSETTISKASSKGIEPSFDYLHLQGIDSADYLQNLSKELKKLPYVVETYNFFELKDSACKKPFITQLRNSHSDNDGYFLKILAKEYYLIDMREYGTTHGTPYSYDTHVPLIWYGNGVNKSEISEMVSTVDIAPTILGLLGIDSPDEIDGLDLFSSSSNR